MQNDKHLKHQETMMLVILSLILALIILVSKFVIGINFSLMEQGGHISIGYHEVHGSQVWSLEFESFTGSITSEGTLPENANRTLMIHSRTVNSNLELTVKCGKIEETYTLSGTPLYLSIPGDQDKFTLTLNGTDVFSGYFNAVWE